MWRVIKYGLVSVSLPFRFAWHLFSSVREAWRDVKELSRPYSYTDVNWNPYPWRANDETSTRIEQTGEHNYARFGKCDLCSNEVWYKIVYTSAGIPVATLLCLRCANDMVQASPHILVCHITAQRDRWRREQWQKGERK